MQSHRYAQLEHLPCRTGPLPHEQLQSWTRHWPQFHGKIQSISPVWFRAPSYYFKFNQERTRTFETKSRHHQWTRLQQRRPFASPEWYRNSTSKTCNLFQQLGLIIDYDWWHSMTLDFDCLWYAEALNRQHLPSASARHGNTPPTWVTTCTTVSWLHGSTPHLHRCPAWKSKQRLSSLPMTSANLDPTRHPKSLTEIPSRLLSSILSVWWPCDFRIEFILLQTVTIIGSGYIRMFSVCSESRRVLQS